MARPDHAVSLGERHFPQRGARGFTLVEVVVAIALAGIVLLGARRMLEGLADAADRVNRSAEEADADGNADRLLRDLAGRLEVGTREAHDFSGAETDSHFTSWCDVPDGWQERCDVRVAIDSVGGTPALTMTLTTGTVREPADSAAGGRMIVLRRGFRSGTFRYLNRPDTGGVWFVAWGHGISAPLALAIILDHGRAAGDKRMTDTLIVRFGERG